MRRKFLVVRSLIAAGVAAIVISGYVAVLVTAFSNPITANVTAPPVTMNARHAATRMPGLFGVRDFLGG